MAMKKIVLFLFLVCFSLTQLVAQEPTFEKGDKVLNLGIGLGSTLYTGSYYRNQIPPITASFEVGIVDNILEKGVIGVGGYLGYASYKWDYSNDDWGYKISNFIIGARGSFHYPLVDKLDTYAGVLTGYRIVRYKEYGSYSGYYDYTPSGGLVWSGFVGARYYFQENLAAMAELGYGIAYLTLGVAVKF
jgi:hypothetical protein